MDVQLNRPWIFATHQRAKEPKNPKNSAVHVMMMLLSIRKKKMHAIVERRVGNPMSEDFALQNAKKM